MCIGFKSELFIYYGVPGNIEGRWARDQREKPMPVWLACQPGGFSGSLVLWLLWNNACACSDWIEIWLARW